MKTLKEIFGVEKPIISMLHMTGYGADEKMEIAKKEIEIMFRNGIRYNKLRKLNRATYCTLSSALLRTAVLPGSG